MYNKILMFFSFLITCVVIFTPATHADDPFNANQAQQPTIMQNQRQMSLSFTKNNGQWDDQVLFRANAGGATMWFTKEGITYQFIRSINKSGGAVPAPGAEQGNSIPGLDSHFRGSDMKPDSVEQLVLKASFVGANPNPEVVGEGQMEYKCNYFLGNDPTKWRTDVPNYSAIVLKEIYPGIDLRYSSKGNGQVAYEFIVSQGADISQIKVEYEGAEETSIDAAGRMIVRTKWGDRIEAIGSGVNSTGLVSPRLSSYSANTMGLEDDNWNQSQLSSRSAGLSYSTYLGGSTMDKGKGIAVDGSGCAYVTGYTESVNFPTHNPYQGSLNGTLYDVFITKMNSTGNGLIYSTYLGGSTMDKGYGIAVDGSGCAYVTGGTYASEDFPIMNPYQNNQGFEDVFVTKLNASGNGLVYSTHLGGTSDEYGHSIKVDGSGRAYVTGVTWSTNFPTLNPYQTNQGGSDAFVTKLATSGSSLIYSTYLGGSGDEEQVSDVTNGAIAIDGSGCAYVRGTTVSADFPTLNAYDASYNGSYDAFVTKLSSTGNSLVYSTYLGGSDVEWGSGIAVDASGCAYVTGQTYSSDFPTWHAFQTDQPQADVFVTKFSASGTSLVYSTYLGGYGGDEGTGIAVDGSLCAYVTGSAGAGFPLRSPYQSYNLYGDCFVSKLTPSGELLVYSTYLGGSAPDQGTGIAVDGSGCAYVTGYTESTNFPTQNPYQGSYQGGDNDVFVAKFTAQAEPQDLGFRPNPNGWQFANTSGNMWPYNWQQGDPADERAVNCGHTRRFPTWALFRDAFGANQTEFQNGTRRPNAVDFWNRMNPDQFGNPAGCWGGSCFGFSISSLQFFDSFLQVSTVFPGFSTLYSVPIRDDSRSLINRFFLYQYGAATQQHRDNNWNTTTPSQTLQACRDMFSSPTRNDRALSAWNNHGRGGHTIVPYNYEQDQSNPNIWYIYVYDNNDPGNDTRRFIINTNSNTWSYDGLPGWGGSWYLFLELPSSQFTTTPTLPKSLLPKEPWNLGGRKGLSSYIDIYLSPTDSVRIESSAGSIGHVGDSLFSTLSNGMPIIPTTGEEAAPIGYFLPNSNWNVLAAGSSDSLLNLAVRADSTLLTYERHNVQVNQVDRVRYVGNDSTLWVVNPDAGNRFYDLKVFSVAADSEIVCSVHDIQSGPSDSIRYSITPSSGLQIDNYGDSTTYDVRVQITGETCDTVFYHEGIVLPANSSHCLVPDWRSHNDSLAILVDSGMTGHFTDTMSVVNEEDPGTYVCGDANHDKIIDVGDVVYLINYLFKNGSAPNPLAAGDANFDGVVDVGDVVYLINYLFKQGPRPCIN